MCDESEMTSCDGCGAEISEDEVQCCEHCDRDGLGNCCIGNLDHPCTAEDKPLPEWAIKAHDTIELYKLRLVAHPPERMDTGTKHFGAVPLRHAHWMLTQMGEFARTGEVRKFSRWLGFVQGILACYCIYSIDEMREHNR